MGLVKYAQANPIRLLKFIYLKNYWSSKVDFWTPAFRRKRKPMKSPLSVCQYVSMSVGKQFFSKMTHKIYLKLHMKLE